MTVTAVGTDIASAHEYFAPISLWRGPVPRQLRAALADAPPVTPNSDSVFTTSANGLVSCILAAEQVMDADTQKALDVQKQNLINLTGVASAYVRAQADKQKNPNLVYNTQLWQDVYNHLPLMAASQFTQQTFDETMHGVQIATSFIETILGFAVGGGPALAGFATFLQGLGSSISAGVKTKSESYSTAAIGIVLETQKVGDELQVLPWLKAYFVDFTESESTVYSNCASAESFHMSFRYRVAQSLFNYRALEDKDVASQFASFVKSTQLDDIESSKNFFGGDFPKAS
ncbi:MAG: hypothetical protein ACK5MT_16665 [Actinomycetales bacterium]